MTSSLSISGGLRVGILDADAEVMHRKGELADKSSFKESSAPISQAFS